MDGAAGNMSQVRVRHWRSTYLVPRTHPAPERVRDRIDSAVQKNVADALASRLRRALDQRSDDLIFVRRLELDFPIDAGWDVDAIAAQCAHALSWRLVRELSIGDASNVVRFSNAAEYLARFLADRANGDAGSRWYYARFSGLNALPCGAALRTVLLEDVDLGISALRMLAPYDLAGVIAALGTVECRRIIDAFEASRPDGENARAFAAMISLSAESAPSGITSAPQLAVWWIAQSKVFVDRALVLAASAVANVTAALRSGNLDAATLRQALVDGNADAIATLARHDPAAFARLRACPPALLRHLLESKKKPTTELESVASTPFGGPFLLLDGLFELPIERVTDGWPLLDRVPAANILRFMVLCHCCGGTRAAAMFLDPLWRRLFGIAPTTRRADVAAWLASLGPRCRHEYAQMLARTEAHDGKISETFAQDAHGNHHRIVTNENGGWHALEIARAGRASEDADETALGSDIDHLLTEDNSLPRAWKLLVALTAQRTLQRFLRKLPGFSSSHLAYAQHNLLAFSASVDAQPERIVVVLGRPPLGLILNFTGCNRGTRHWPLLDPRPFAMFGD